MPPLTSISPPWCVCPQKPPSRVSSLPRGPCCCTAGLCCVMAAATSAATWPYPISFGWQPSVPPLPTQSQFTSVSLAAWPGVPPVTGQCFSNSEKRSIGGGSPALAAMPRTDAGPAPGKTVLITAHDDALRVSKDSHRQNRRGAHPFDSYHLPRCGRAAAAPSRTPWAWRASSESSQACRRNRGGKLCSSWPSGWPWRRSCPCPQRSTLVLFGRMQPRCQQQVTIARLTASARRCPPRS